jgi:glycosyltransferase involved in cell wall biosynthesis
MHHILQADVTTTVVVPCYNEAGRFDLRAFDAFLRGDKRTSLLLVDDGSTDETPQLLEQLRSRYPLRVSVFRCERNGGKAEAVRRGMLLALRQRPALVGYWDADLATPLEAVSRFREVLIEHPERTLVMGSRVALLGRAIERKWSRHLLGRAFATAASLTLGLAVYDTQCGAKLFRVTPTTTELFERPFHARWIFDVELLARMVAAARRAGGQPVDELVYELPLERWQDVHGSRLKTRDFFVAAWDLVAIYWRYVVRRPRPLQSAATPKLPGSTAVPPPTYRDVA